MNDVIAAVVIAAAAVVFAYAWITRPPDR